MKVSSGPRRTGPKRTKGLDDVLKTPFGYIARFGSKIVSEPERSQAEHEELVAKIVSRHPDSVRAVERHVAELAKEVRKLKAFSLMNRGLHEVVELTSGPAGQIASSDVVAMAKLKLSYLQAILLEVRPASYQREVDEETWARVSELLSRIFGTFKTAWLSESASRTPPM